MALSNELSAIGIPAKQADFLGDTQANGLTALGTTQGDALPITASINSFDTVTLLNQACVLPAIAATKFSEITIRDNDAAFGMQVFPAIGESINALAANASLTFGPAAGITLKKVSATKWISVP